MIFVVSKDNLDAVATTAKVVTREAFQRFSTTTLGPGSYEDLDLTYADFIMELLFFAVIVMGTVAAAFLMYLQSQE